MIKKLTAIALMIITMMCGIGSVAPVSADSGDYVNVVSKFNVRKIINNKFSVTVPDGDRLVIIVREKSTNKYYYFYPGVNVINYGLLEIYGISDYGRLLYKNDIYDSNNDDYVARGDIISCYDFNYPYDNNYYKSVENQSDKTDYVLYAYFMTSLSIDEFAPYFADYFSDNDDLDFTSTTTEARFTSLGDYTDVTSNQIRSFFTANAVTKKTSTSDGTRANYNELFGNGSYIETTYYLPTDISIPSYFIPNKSKTNEVSFRFTNRDVKNLKIVVSKYTNVSDKVTTPDTGIFSFARSMTANYMHQYIAFQPESFKDIPKNKVLHYKFDMSGLVSLISQNKTYNDYWGGTAYYYDLFDKVIDESKKAEAFVLELYGDDKLLTSATYCYTGSLRFDEPTGEPAVEFIVKDKDDGFEPTIDDDSEKIGGFDDAEKDDTVIKNPVGDYDLNFNIDDIGLAVMSSVNSTKSLFTFAWSLFPAAFMTLVLGALGLIVILRVLGR